MRVEYDDTGKEFQMEQGEFNLNRGDGLRAFREAIFKKQMSKTEPAEEPITKEQVAKPVEKGAPKPLPDRAMVSKELSAFLRAQKRAPDPVNQELAQIKQAVSSLSQPKEELTFEQQMAYTLQNIERRLAEQELRQQQQAAEAAYQQRIADYSEEFTNYVRSKQDSYPAIVALGREDTVFNELLALADQEQAISEDELLSQYEAQIKNDYEALKSVYEKPSQEPNPSETPETTENSSDDVVSQMLRARGVR